ncbi:hypothetical protein ACLKA6_013749 [Drosophila palustris]
MVAASKEVGDDETQRDSRRLGFLLRRPSRDTLRMAHGQNRQLLEKEEEEKEEEEEATSWYPHDLAKEDISTT